MKIKISREEAKNIIASCSKEDLQGSAEGNYKKFHVEDLGDSFELEYIYDDNGNLKEQFANCEVKDE